MHIFWLLRTSVNRSMTMGSDSKLLLWKKRF